MKIYIIYFFYFAVLFNLSSCRPAFNGIVKKRHTSFGLTPAKNWQVKNFRGADIYLTNDQENASFVVSATCERVSQSPLIALTAQILADFTQIKYLDQRSIIIANREGLLSEILAKLDGVERYLKILVIRKNNCVYDIVLTSDKKRQDCDKDFDEMVKTFWAKVDGL